MVQGLRNSWVITVGIRANVHMHEVLLDTHAQAPDLNCQCKCLCYDYYVYVNS